MGAYLPGGGYLISGTLNINQAYTFAWDHCGTGVANGVGLLLTGADAMISHHGNSCNPAVGWSGRGTTAAFLDATTSSTGSTGMGAKGFAVGIDGKSSFPRMSRGSLGYWFNPTVCEEGHVYVCRITNGPVTLTPGAHLRLANGASFSPSSNGATVTFRMKGDVAYEIGRTAY